MGRRAWRIAAYAELTKPGIAGFVTITTGVSYVAGAGGFDPLLPLLHTLVGATLATAGALALNQYLERRPDALMRRTRTRPIPSGRISAGAALLFGCLLLGAGVGWLWATVGALPALLTLASAAAYDLVYTPLKTRSYVATMAGAIPGALPALIGWSAATGAVTVGGLVLFGIVFLWQLPHVLSLAWLLRDDYLRAGFLMAPPTDPEGRVMGIHLLLYSTLLIPMSVFPALLGIAGWIYLSGALALGLLLLGSSGFAAARLTHERARRVFLASLAYHPVVFGLLLLDVAWP